MLSEKGNNKLIKMKLPSILGFPLPGFNKELSGTCSYNCVILL